MVRLFLGHRNPNEFLSVVFVHGLTGDLYKTWTAPGRAEPWPRELLPGKLPQTRILTFGYDAYVANWRKMVSNNTIGSHARALIAALATYREDDQTVITFFLSTSVNIGTELHRTRTR
jgi:hypothetical protein